MLFASHSLLFKRPTLNRFYNYRPGIRFLLFVFISMFSVTVFSNEISLKQAVEKTLEASPQIGSADYRVKAAEGFAKQATTRSQPKLNLDLEDAGGSDIYTGIDNAQTTLSLSWLMEGQLLKRKRALGEATIDAFTIRKQIKELDLATETSRLFLTLLLFQARQELSQDAVMKSEELVKALERRASAGRSSSAELLRARAELSSQKLKLEDLSHEILTVKRSLAAQWGAKQVDFERAAGTLDIGEDLSEASLDEALLTENLEQNPNLQLYLTKERMAASEFDIIKAKARAGIQFNVGVRSYQSNDESAFVGGVSIPMGGKRSIKGKLIEIENEQEAYRLDYQAEKIKTDVLLFTLVQELRHALHVSKELQQNVVPLLNKALAETRKAYALGKYGYQELLAVQKELNSTKSALLEAKFKAHINRIEIERLTGVRISQ